MTEPFPAKNVVDLLGRRSAEQRPAVVSVPDTIAKVRDATFPLLLAALRQSLDEIDDTLFGLSERAGNATASARFFDDLREIRRHREAMIAAFESALRSLLLRFTQGTLHAPKTPSENEADSLSLVDHLDLELTLASARIATRAEEGSPQLRLELAHRFAALLGYADISAPTPLNGKLVAAALREAMTPMTISLESHLILLKRLEKAIGDAVNLSVEKANVILHDAGILPDVKVHRRPKHGADAGAPDPSKARGAQGRPAEPGERAHADGPHGELSALASEVSRLIASSRFRQGQVAQQASDAAPREIDAETAASRLSTSAEIGGGDSAEFAQSVRTALTTEAERQQGARLSDETENAIDLVSMMFDFVQRDDALPREIQEAMSPLRLPLLRSALRGGRVFDSEAHPLRALMESAAELGRSWSPESDRDGRVLSKIRESVAAAVFDQDASSESIERAQGELQDFMSTENRRAQLLEKRASEAARAQESRVLAQRTSQKLIAEVLEQTPVPAVVGTLLNGPLRRHLELVHARRGEESKDWKSARKLVRDVVWSFDPETISVERAHWQAMLPNIVNALRGALSAVGMHDEDIEGVAGEFRSRYRELVEATQMHAGSAPASFGVIDADQLPDAPAPEQDALTEMPAAELAATATAATAATSAEAPEAPTDAGTAAEDTVLATRPQLTHMEALAQVRALKLGAWFELSNPQGQQQRGKLIWSSSSTQRCLFVNRNGQLISDMSYAAVAVELMMGHIHPVTDGSLFERALSDVRQRLTKPVP